MRDLHGGEETAGLVNRAAEGGNMVPAEVSGL